MVTTLKLIGGLTLVFASGSLGFLVAHNMKKRVRLLAGLQGFLQFLMTEIDFAVTLLPDALTKIGRAADQEIESFSRNVVLRLKEGSPLSAAWDHSLRLLSSGSVLTEEDLEPMRVLAPVLGLSDRQDQLRHLKLAHEHLRLRELQAERDVNQNQKLWRYLGVLSGLVIVLLLV